MTAEVKQKQPTGAKRRVAEEVISEGINNKKPIKTPNGATLRLDLYGVSLQGHPEEATGGDPCPTCKNHRGIRLEETPEYMPLTNVEESRTVHFREFVYSEGQTTMTPRTEKKVIIHHQGFSRKYLQKCGCGASLGHVWQYCPELHGRTLCDFYFSV